jgi:hypothetical protein
LNKALIEWLKVQPQIFTIQNAIADKTNSQYHPNALSVGYTIEKFTLSNGATIELVHNPMFDDPNSEIDPITGNYIESMRMIFIDVTGGDGMGNIEIVKKQGAMKFGYVNGLVTPYGPINNQPMAHEGDWYSMVLQTKEGIIVKDPTLTGMLVFERNY